MALAAGRSALAAGRCAKPAAETASVGECVSQPATQAHQHVPQQRLRRRSTHQHGKTPQGRTSTRRPPAARSEEEGSADQAGQPEREAGFVAARRAQEPLGRRASARAARHRDPGPREPLRSRRRRTRPIARSSRVASRKTTSSSRPPPSATRRKRRSRRDEAKKTNPGAAGQQQTRQPGRPDHGRRAQEGDRLLHAHQERVPELPGSSTRSSTTSPTSTSRRTTSSNARKVYYELIQKRAAVEVHPQRVPRVRRALLQRGAGRPLEVGSRRAGATRRSSSTRRRTTRCSGYAGTSSRYVYWNKGEFPQVAQRVQEDHRLRRPVRAAPRTPRSSPTAARRDIIPVYALTGDPDAAYNFFHNLSGDAAGENEKTFKMMDDLGSELPRHRSLSRGDRALPRPHVARQGRDSFCVYQAHITEATLAMKSGNKDAHQDRARQPDRGLQRVQGSNHAAEAEAEVREQDRRAPRRDRRWRGTSRPSARAAFAAPATRRRWRSRRTSTRRSSTTSRPSEFSKFEFPRIVKDDWPTIFKIKYAMADLLYFQQGWAECGPAFDSVVAEDPAVAEAAEAAYASVLCYQNIYERRRHKGGADRKGGGNLPGQGAARRRRRPRRAREVQARRTSPTTRRA